ncbi:DMT family transporter [Nocardia coffeae]|uniref:DMT family transporter n=1 Tax=Nocardia coffeae TaxID=2873381 RepID=UPI0027E0B615|nr:DMT family transporter [Nocardia coffeae]
MTEPPRAKVFPGRSFRGTPRRSRTSSVDLALVAVAVTWGSSYLAAKNVATPDTVFGFLVLRFGIGAGALAILLAPRLRRTTRTELALGVLFGLILSVIFVLETFGVTQTSASNAGLIISLTIVITPLLGGRHRALALPRTYYGATAVAVAGIVLLTQSTGFTVPGLGDLLILLAAFVRALHVTVIANLSAGKQLDSSRMTLIQLATVLVVAAVFSQVDGSGLGPAVRTMTMSGWALTVYLALACTVFAFFVQMWAVRRTSPARVSLLLGTEPLWAAAFGVLLAGDPLTVVSVLGAALVLAGTNWARTIDNERQNSTSM